MKLYLLRHGRTIWNAEGRLQGRTDIHLSDEGRREAREAARLLANVPFSAAFSSPLHRAQETAELILAGRGIPVQSDERLTELDFGSAEGQCLPDLPGGAQSILCLFSAPEDYVTPPGGEDYAALVARCRNFVEDVLLPREQEWGHVLLVAHGCTVRGMFSALFGRASNEIFNGRVQKNCAVNIIDCTAGQFHVDVFAGEYCEEI